MDIFDFLSLLGALALFLYGMQVMSEGLSHLAGGRMEGWLERWTGRPWKALLAGTIVTAAVQSSSAVTVAVVGLAGSGALGLTQAMGLIMGANIGTTLTAWIFAGNAGKAGLPGGVGEIAGGAADGAVFLRMMLRPDLLAPVLAFAGVGILLFSKSGKRKKAARGAVGFAILVFGMNAMEEAAAPIVHSPFFAKLLEHLENPLRGVLGGCVMTAAIQSSSASVGILQALCEGGRMTYGVVIPVIMGQNIGTCVTALLACAGMSCEAKRAAFLNLYFNLIGTAGFLFLFCLADALHPFAFLESPADSTGIAAFHSGFNLLSALCLLPFSGKIVRLAQLTVKQDGFYGNN